MANQWTFVQCKQCGKMVESPDESDVMCEDCQDERDEFEHACIIYAAYEFN